MCNVCQQALFAFSPLCSQSAAHADIRLSDPLSSQQHSSHFALGEAGASATAHSSTECPVTKCSNACSLPSCLTQFHEHSAASGRWSIGPAASIKFCKQRSWPQWPATAITEPAAQSKQHLSSTPGTHLCHAGPANAGLYSCSGELAILLTFLAHLQPKALSLPLLHAINSF